MPQAFLSQQMGQQDSIFGKAFVGAAGLLGGALAERAGGKISYQVWECPGCGCQTLVSIVKTPTGTQEKEIASLSSCR